jgi:hypothetical protein
MSKEQTIPRNLQPWTASSKRFHKAADIETNRSLAATIAVEVLNDKESCGYGKEVLPTSYQVIEGPKTPAEQNEQ